MDPIYVDIVEAPDGEDAARRVRALIDADPMLSESWVQWTDTGTVTIQGLTSKRCERR
ncbi:MAG: hypothetical protein GY711_05715 [bacterium]|nr:hypothetical protein [bacterium]